MDSETRVTVTRRTTRCRRSRNGAWMYAGTDTETFAGIPESRAIDYAFGGGLSSFTEIRWPDRHLEVFWRELGHCGPRVAGPGDSRLRAYAGGEVYGEGPGSTWYLRRIR